MNSTFFTLSCKNKKYTITVDSKKIRDDLLTRGCHLTDTGDEKIYLRMNDGSYATHAILNSPASEGQIRFKNGDTLDLRKKNLLSL